MRKRKILFTVFILVTFVFSCDSKIPAPYISFIPDISEFEYIPVYETLPDQDIADSSIIRIISPPVWANSDEPELPHQVFGLVQSDSVVWVVDPVRGEIKTFSNKGSYLKKVALRGKGPGDAVRPALIKKASCSEISGNTCMWVLDTGSRALLEYDLAGNEQQRLIHRAIPHTFFNVQLDVMMDGKFIIPIEGDTGFVAGIMNRNGILEKKFIPRIVPFGYQPSVYNNLVFSYQPSTDDLAYSYNGLPQIYIRNINGGADKVFDLYPGIPLKDFNRDLTPYTGNKGGNGVSSVINDMMYYRNYLLFTIKTTLFVLNLNTDRIDQIINFRHKNGEKLMFQQMVLTGENVFLIDRFRLIYYSFPVSEITGGIQPVAQISD